jgi:phosphoenolpyruvate synthase/pyruvate phosphate dikinase
MRRELAPLDVRVPNGFATTADAYRAFLRDAGVDALVTELLGELDATDVGQLQDAGRRLRGAILAADLAPALAAEIRDGYRRLEREYGADCDVAVRSSATAGMIAMEPIGRMGTPEEVAEAVVWLCSDGASFMTGHPLVVDGGFVAR